MEWGTQQWILCASWCPVSHWRQAAFYMCSVWCLVDLFVFSVKYIFISLLFIAFCLNIRYSNIRYSWVCAFVICPYDKCFNCTLLWQWKIPKRAKINSKQATGSPLSHGKQRLMLRWFHRLCNSCLQGKLDHNWGLLTPIVPWVYSNYFW